MIGDIKKPTKCVNTGQAIKHKVQRHFTKIAGRVKADFFRLAAWLSVVFGVM